MFVITINRKKMVKSGLIALCAIVVAITAVAFKGFFTEDSTTALIGNKTTKLTTTAEMAEYIASKGFTADLQTARVAEVKIPKKFDDSFMAFNEKIKQNDGMSLEKYKGDKVNKWTFNLLDYPDGEACAVLLIRKEKLIGTYILKQPEGTAVGMVGADTQTGEQDKL